MPPQKRRAQWEASKNKDFFFFEQDLQESLR